MHARYPKIERNQISCITTILDVDLYVFDGEKRNERGFKARKPSYIPLLPHNYHFYAVRESQKLDKIHIIYYIRQYNS